MKLILDFDDALFNAKELKDVIFRVLREHGVENGEELYTRERSKVGNIFMPKEFLKNACSALDMEDSDVVTEVNVDELYDEIMSECPRLINQGLVVLTTSVGKENCYIISNGSQEFQMDKMKRSGVGALVGSIIVVPGSKKQEIEKICRKFPNEEVIFADNKSIFFDDLDREVCNNLKTVLYNENGLESLMAEIEVSRLSEQSRGKEISTQTPTGPGMR